MLTPQEFLLNHNMTIIIIADQTDSRKESAKILVNPGSSIAHALGEGQSKKCAYAAHAIE